MLSMASAQSALLRVGAIASDQPCTNIAWLSASRVVQTIPHAALLLCQVILSLSQSMTHWYVANQPSSLYMLENSPASTFPMLQDSNSSLAKIEVVSPAANQAESTEAHQQLECVKDAGHDDLFQAQRSTSPASQKPQSRQAEVAEADGTPVLSEGHIQATLQKVDVQAANAQNKYQLIRSVQGAWHLQSIRGYCYHCSVLTILKQLSML